MAWFVLIVAVLSRVLPVLLHGVGGGVTFTSASLLFFGAELHGRRRWTALIAIAALAATDYWLTVYGYGYPFHVTSYLPTWAWHGAVILGSSEWLGHRRTATRIAAAAIAAPTGFFLLSNGVMWLRGGMYPHTGGGLLACYTAGLPFYRNDLVSTVAFTALVFTLAYVLQHRAGMAWSTGHGGGPAAA